MSRWLPHVLLGLLLLAAGMTWAVGWHLSEHIVVQRLPRDRRALHESARAIQQSLARLESNYTTHVQKLAGQIQPNQDILNKRFCESIVGVVRCSVINPEDFGRIDNHVDIDVAAAAKLPRPAMYLRGTPATPVVLITSDDALSVADGWLEKPGQPLIYLHLRNTGQLIALTIALDQVNAAMTTSLKDEAKLPKGSAGVRLVSPEGKLITQAGRHDSSEAADFTQPLPTRFGTWQIESWDERQPSVVIDHRVRVGSSSVAFVLAGVGIVTWRQQRRALQRAQQRVSFVNSVSHELRTPLTNMLLNLDLAAEELPEHPRLDHVRQEAGRLGRLIENVLTFSRAEQGKLELRPQACDVSALIRVLVQTFEPLFQRRGIGFETKLDLPASLTVDADALTQIIANMLSNIEKYAPQASASLVAWFSEGQLKITISDTGPGIPLTDAERIFEPFVRLRSNVTEGVTGTGLGLAIARDLAQRMGGSLALIPCERGATFQLMVPA